MNSKNLLIIILVNIFLLLQNYKSSIFIKNNISHNSISINSYSKLSSKNSNNINCRGNIGKDKKDNKKDIWKIIKGHKGLSKYAHDKARDYIKKGKAYKLIYYYFIYKEHL